MARVISKQRERALKRKLRDLRIDWKAWKTGKGLYQRIGCHGGHPALYFCEHTTPEHTTPDQDCEGCASALYRADRRAEIEREAAPITAELATS